MIKGRGIDIQDIRKVWMVSASPAQIAAAGTKAAAVSITIPCKCYFVAVQGYSASGSGTSPTLQFIVKNATQSTTLVTGAANTINAGTTVYANQFPTGISTMPVPESQLSGQTAANAGDQITVDLVAGGTTPTTTGLMVYLFFQ